MSLATPFTNEVPCARCPLRQCKVFRTLSDEEVEFVQSLKTGELRMGPGATVLHEGQPSAHDALLQQLALLHGEILAREKKIGRSAAEVLAKQQRFLESKKSR